ncbi:hypothetical protein P8C59_008859 [Phyllachora maydis]|uniref:Uncharacterized protein n=1 Tax=Phyllachora maydis TaxID=1825666 RepID=A0AAD9MKE9_9PEZI|nr:hypothetical protein P8C59_008859 [Phyllachora maydis]
MAIAQLRPEVEAPIPYKDDQDRNSVKPRSTEYTKSGTDSNMAAQSDAAFNPNKTDPGQEKDAAQENGNSLEVSGANPHISKPQGENPDQTVSDTSGKQRKSGGGSPTKGGS